MTDQPAEFGLYILRHDAYSWREQRVTVKVVRWSEDGKSIRGLVGLYPWQMAKGHAGREYDELNMQGHVYGKQLIGFEPKYRDVNDADLRRVERMLKTLRALDALKRAWLQKYGGEITPPNMLGILAKFVGAKFVVFEDSAKQGAKRDASFDAISWEFLSVADGIRIYEREIYDLCQKHEEAA